MLKNDSKIKWILGAKEMSFYKRMLRTLRWEHVSDDEVLKKTKNKNFILTIRKRRRAEVSEA